MGVVSRHGGSCDFAQDDTRVFMAHAVATPSAQVGRFARDAAARFAPGTASRFSPDAASRCSPGTASRFSTDAASRFAPGASLVVILRAVAGSTRANAIARSAA